MSHTAQTLEVFRELQQTLLATGVAQEYDLSVPATTMYRPMGRLANPLTQLYLVQRYAVLTDTRGARFNGETADAIVRGQNGAVG